MAITLVGTFGGGVDAGNLTVTLPSGISFGDAIGAVGVCSTAQTLTAPAGWSVRSGFPADGGNARMYAWVKDSVTASDSGASVTFTSSGGNKIVVAGFVAHSGNGFPADWTDDLTFTARNAASTSYVAPASTSTQAGDWGVAAFAARGTGPFSDWTPATGLVERQEQSRTGNGATSLHLCDANGSVGGSGVNWGPFTESNISTSNGGALTWLVKENTSGGGGGGGGGGGSLYPKLGLWRQRSGTNWRADMNSAEATYGPFQGHWSYYTGTNESNVPAEVVTAFDDGNDLFIYWKPYDTHWADTAAGGWDAQIDSFADDVVAMCSGSGRKIWLTVHHEPENDTTGSSGNYSYSAWRGMWQQVRARFDLAGASQYVTWVATFMNSHTNPSSNPIGPGQTMIQLWGNDGVMDGLVDVVSQQDYIPAGTTPSTIATKWLEDLEFLVANDSTGRHWSYLHKPQAFTEWGADLGGEIRGTNSHRAQTIAAIEGILPDLASRNVVGITYYDARTNVIDDPPSVDGIAFQSLKDATEAGQSTGPIAAAGVSLARDGATATANTIGFTLPAGWQQGDYATVWLSTNSNPDITTTPTGWELEEGPVTAGANVQRGWRYAKTLTAGEANPTWTLSQSIRGSGVMVVLRGVGSAAGTVLAAPLTATASGTSHAAAAVTVPSVLSDGYAEGYLDGYGAGDDIAEAVVITAWLTRWADASSNGGVNYGTPPGTHTTLGSVSVDSDANPGAGALVAELTANPVGAGTYGPYTATFPVTSTGICGQLAILPAAPSTPTPTIVFGTATATFGLTATASGTTIPAVTPGAQVPDVGVQVAFASQPMAPAPAFTALPMAGTGAVQQPIVITHGRADEFGDVQPGTLAAGLRNEDGRYTLGKTSGPHGSGVKPGRRVRATIIYQGTQHIRHDGHANAWPTSWPTGRNTYAAGELSSTDRLKLLGRPAGRADSGRLRSMLEEETLRDTPAIYYPLSESENATSAGSITKTPAAGAVSTPVGIGGGTINFGEGTGPGTDGLSAPVFNAFAYNSGRLLAANPVSVNGDSPGGLTLSCWFNTTTEPSPNPMVMAALTTGPGDDAVILAITPDGRVQAFIIDDGWGQFGNQSPLVYTDGNTHHAAVTLTRSGSTVTVRLVVDGAVVQTGTYTRTSLGTFSQLDIGGFHISDNWAPYSGTLSHVAAFAGALSTTRLNTHYRAGRNGLEGERTDQRIARVADWIGLPAADRALDAGDKRMGPQSTAGKTPLDVMREAAAAEQGVLFISPDGKLTFHRLGRRYNRTSPDLTLDVNQGHIAVGLVLPGDDYGMVNDLTVTRPGGAEQRAINQVSVDEYGSYDDSLEIPAFSDNEAQAVGNWRVGNYGTPRPRIPNLTVSLSRLHETNPALVTAILNLRISSLIRLQNLPTQAPGTTVDVFLEGWTETIGTGVWSIELNCSPADPYTVATVGGSTVGSGRVAL